MNTYLKLLTLAATAFALGACEDTAQTYLEDFNAFQEDYDTRFGSATPTLPNQMPVSGTATYTGFVSVDQTGGNVAGRATFDANFGAGTVRMSTNDYYLVTPSRTLNGPASGNLAMNNGVIDQGSISGTVTGGVNGTVYNEAFDGFFYGDTADAIYMVSESISIEAAGVR